MLVQQGSEYVSGSEYDSKRHFNQFDIVRQDMLKSYDKVYRSYRNCRQQLFQLISYSRILQESKVRLITSVRRYGLMSYEDQ